MKLANRELGAVSEISEGRMTLRMDDGRTVAINPVQHPHLDHGYAVTSHSSQGQTADRVLIHVDTQLGAKDLLNHRMAYVAVSRGAHDAQIFTDNRQGLEKALGREVSHTSGLAPEKGYTPAEIERHQAPIREALEPEDASQFRWIGETGTVQSYRHLQTGKNIHIDGKGQFYSQDGRPTSQEAALDRAMPEGREQPQIEYGRGMGIVR